MVESVRACIVAASFQGGQRQSAYGEAQINMPRAQARYCTDESDQRKVARRFKVWNEPPILGRLVSRNLSAALLESRWMPAAG
jgi:hypothetical protein